MRMLAGVLTAHPFTSTMIGDESLSRRPMRRVIVPLEQMGARISSNDGRPPLTIAGCSLPDANRLRAGGAERAGQERGPARRDSTQRASRGSARPSPREIIRSGRLPRSVSTSVRDGPERQRSRGTAPRQRSSWPFRVICPRPRSGWWRRRRFRARKSL